MNERKKKRFKTLQLKYHTTYHDEYYPKKTTNKEPVRRAPLFTKVVRKPPFAVIATRIDVPTSRDHFRRPSSADFAKRQDIQITRPATASFGSLIPESKDFVPQVDTKFGLNQRYSLSARDRPPTERPTAYGRSFVPQKSYFSRAVSQKAQRERTPFGTNFGGFECGVLRSSYQVSFKDRTREGFSYRDGPYKYE